FSSTNPQLRLVGSQATCEAFAQWVNNTTQRQAIARHYNVIWQVGLSGLRQIHEVAALLYESASIFLDRKFALYRRIQQAVLLRPRFSVCSVRHCGREYYGKGLCKNHYQQHKRQEKRAKQKHHDGRRKRAVGRSLSRLEQHRVPAVSVDA